MGMERLLCTAAGCYSRYLGSKLLRFPGAVHRIPTEILIHQNKPSMSTTLLICRGIWTRFFTTRLQTPQKPTHIACRRLCTSTQILKDVVLFHHDRTRFFRLLAIFCGGQLVFWSYLAHFAYTGLRDTSTARGGTTSGESQHQRTIATSGLAGLWSFEMNLGSDAWRYGFTLGCLAMGGWIVGLGVLFGRRSVSRVVLHKGGRMVTVATQSPLGPDRGRSITVPLAQVACHAHRHESPSFIPLRVKGHRFYFLLDKEGTLNNVKLFDVTVGAYRPF